MSFLLSELQSLRAALLADEQEKRKLVEENRKLKYRIVHLLRSLEEEVQKNESTASAATK